MENKSTPASLRSEFCSHAARVLSFKTKKSTPKASRWPHPESFALTPSVLASAGYFHNPADHEPDRTTCWMCGESMKGWAEDDEPWQLHLKYSPDCPFARLALLEHQRTSNTPSWSESTDQTWGTANEWFPRGEILIEARLATFCGPTGPWKHEDKDGVPSRLELARAGFHFTPNLHKKGRKFDVDDTTSCCYCHRTVTEWEVDDDPVSVHLKKGPCIFFTAVQPSDPPKSKISTTKTRKTSKNVKSSRTLSTTVTEEASEVETVVSNAEPNGVPKSKKAKKKSSATSGSTKPPSRRGAESSSRVVASGDDEDSEPASGSRQRLPRAAQKLATLTTVAPSSPEPVEHQASKPPVALAKSTRLSRSTSKTSLKTSTNRKNTQASTTKTRNSSSNNSWSMTDGLIPHDLRPETIMTEHGQIDAGQVEEDEMMLSAPTKKSHQSNTSKAVAVSDSDETSSRPTRKARQTRTKAKEPERSRIEHSSEDDTLIERTKSKSSKKAPKTRAAESTIGSPAQNVGEASVKSPGLAEIIESSIRTIPVISAQSIFAGFNPQAPQLYPGRLPIAGKVIYPSLDTTAASASPLTKPPTRTEAQGVVNDEGDVETLLNEYLSQKPVPIPPGWLANPFNPSKPLPPLTEEEGKMPLGEYFAYRAQQEEDAFLLWVEEQRIKPWLAAVEKAQRLVEGLVGSCSNRKPQQQTSKQNQKPIKTDQRKKKRNPQKTRLHSNAR